MFIEIHLIQNFAPSNLNRDDTNNPKDADFGGVRRARISSQAIKRAVREHPIFEQTTQVDNGTRTRLLARKVAQVLQNSGKTKEEAEAAAQEFTGLYLGGLDKKPEKSKVLFYISPKEVDEIVKSLLENWDTLGEKNGYDSIIKELKKATKDRTSAPDIAMFGRMLANDPNLNLDAACQVAHAISTHRVNMDMDFFTAVDDLQEREETGSAMMGVTAFNSACFYRYNRIDWAQLVKNLDGNLDLAVKAVEGFIRAAALAIPSGKQNSFAAQNMPDLIFAVVRGDGQSWSLANAFETPVYFGRGGGLVQDSVKQLADYWQNIARMYGQNKSVTPFIATMREDFELGELAEAVVQPNSLEALVNSVVAELPVE